MVTAGQSDVLDEEGQANPIISWSDLHVLYQLPDGSKWAEHGNFFDCEDLVSSFCTIQQNQQQCCMSCLLSALISDSEVASSSHGGQ